MTEREMIARMIRIDVEDNCSIYQAKENDMTSTLKLTKSGDVIKVKIVVETEVTGTEDDDLAGVVVKIDELMLRASRNIGDYDQVKIDSKGQMTCVQLAETEPEKSEKKAE